MYPVKKSIYNGCDNRANIFELKNSDSDFVTTLYRQAESVACLIDESQLIKKGSSFILQNPDSLRKRFHLSSHERFADEPSVGSCTAFLIDENHAVTAAHCVCFSGSDQLNTRLISSLRLIFGFQMKEDGSHQNEFNCYEDVYSIQSVTAHKYDKKSGTDWAILELNTYVYGRTPLKICTYPVDKGDELYMLGYPSGIPLKVADCSKVILNEEEKDYFQCDIDAFRGNSGSPVFSRTSYQVIGILCGGNPDYEFGNRGYQVHHVTQEDIAATGYEKCQRMNTIAWLTDRYEFSQDYRSDAQQQYSNPGYEKREESPHSNGFTMTYRAFIGAETKTFHHLGGDYGNGFVIFMRDLDRSLKKYEHPGSLSKRPQQLQEYWASHKI